MSWAIIERPDGQREFCDWFALQGGAYARKILNQNHKKCSKIKLREFQMATSNKTASHAGKDLRDPKTPKKDRGPIASDLAQAKKKK